MQSRWNFHISLLTVFVAATGFGMVSGCQKSGDTPPPTAALNAQAAAGEGSAPRPVSDQDPKHPIFRIETTKGNIDVRLDADKAPVTVDNFRNYAERGHYNNTIFHQIVKQPVQVVIGGGYGPDMVEKKAMPPIRNEAYNGLKNVRGTIAMARRNADENSATCQFFFNLTDDPQLDHKARTLEGFGYCVFGQVMSGMEVLDAIAQIPVGVVKDMPGVPSDTVTIRSVKQIK